MTIIHANKTLHNTNDIKKNREKIRSQFIDEMLYILQMVNEKHSHLPPSKISHFGISFIIGNKEINLSKGNNTGVLNMFKEMLQEGPPLLLGR